MNIFLGGGGVDGGVGLYSWLGRLVLFYHFDVKSWQNLIVIFYIKMPSVEEHLGFNFI